MIHLSYDLVELYAVMEPVNPRLYPLQYMWGGSVFLVIAGISATLGSHPVKRGLQVLGCGMLCTAATAGMYLLDFAGKGIVIYFGVLHCLGLCMLLWVAFRKCPWYVLGILGVILTVLGLYFKNVTVPYPWLIPIGLAPRGFFTSDYFPLLPNFGYFLVGAMAGKLLYRQKVSLFPKVNEKNPIARFFCFCGRHSLLFYLLHQPILIGVIGLILLLF